ncbi:hypothetical protein HYH03_014349 [Edaphochlamys debaryana]|uniref:Uncharacterized protein n=1 Tax=Edaphochlamys debaryana TaxID=47281 RepID=A0A835XN65_9CHLO|nr:hypothetical protein HYH03_014349 [Edaphochlamys debaryana]|eukprot:KAG2486976.1 hypothetical protein HYH03_014349 [Edaphochlamys debaryana]
MRRILTGRCKHCSSTGGGGGGGGGGAAAQLSGVRLSRRESVANSSSDGGGGSPDWGLTIVGVPRLRLVNSVISDLPLSPAGPLLEVLGCDELSLQNVVLSRLVARPPWGAFGAVRVAGSLRRAAVQGMRCHDVWGARGWACLLLSADSASRAADGVTNTVEVNITESVFEDNAASGAAGVYGVSCPLSDDAFGSGVETGQQQQPDGFGAVAVQALPGAAGGSAAAESADDSLNGIELTVLTRLVLNVSTLDGNFATWGGAAALVPTASSPATTAATKLKAGVFHSEEPARNIRLQANSRIYNNSVDEEGGAVFSTDSSVDGFVITGGTQVFGNRAAYRGAVVYADKKLANLIIEDGSQVYDNVAPNGGGVAAAGSSMERITIRNSSVYRNRAARGGCLFTPGTLRGFQVVAGSSVHDNSAAGDSISGGGVALAMGTVADVLVSNSIVFSNTADYTGGFIQSDTALLNVSFVAGSRVYNNSAAFGGSVFCGGPIDGFVVDSSEVSGNKASRGNAGGGGVGAVLATQQSLAHVWIRNGSRLFDNAAELSGSIMSAAGSAANVTVSGSDLYGNFAGASQVLGNAASKDGGWLYVAGSSAALLIEGGSTLGWNSGGASGGAIALLGPCGRLVLNGSALVGNRAGASGGAIAAASVVGGGSVEACNVSANSAGQHGGGLYLEGLSGRLEVSWSAFEGNAAVVGRGGSLYATAKQGRLQSAAGLSIGDTLFRSSTAGSGGGAVVVNVSSGGCAAADATGPACPSVTLRNTSFLNCSAALSGDGGGLAATLSGPSLALTACRFEGCSAELGRGGGAFVESTGITNQATSSGGGLLLQGVQQAWLEHVGFTGNGAATGGGLYVSAGASQQQTSTARRLLPSASADATMLVLADFLFANNEADADSASSSTSPAYAGYGGSIFLSQSVAAALIRGSFQCNSASEFGPGVATLQDMGSCSRGDQQANTTTTLEAGQTLRRVPGVASSLRVELVNAAGETVSDHPSITVLLSFGAGGSFDAVQSVPNGPVPLYQGVAIWESVIFRGWAGSGYRLNVSVEVREVLSSTVAEVTPSSVAVELLPCPLGSSIQAGPAARPDQASCQPCPSLQFSLWVDPRNSSMNAVESFSNTTLADVLEKGVCHPCPSDAYCPGGAVVVPLAGFWQSAANSTLMHRCFSDAACAPGSGTPAAVNTSSSTTSASARLVACQQAWYASQPPGAAVVAALNASNATTTCLLWDAGPGYSPASSYPQLQCAEGYGGLLCATCDPGHHLTSSFDCQECPSQGATVVLGALAFLATSALILFTAWTTFQEDYMKQEAGQQVNASDKLAVLITHMQYLIIITRLNLGWPDIINRMTGALSALTGVSTLTFSPTCLFSGLDSAGQARVRYAWSFISPIMATALAMLVWTVRYMFYNQALLRRGGLTRPVGKALPVRHRWSFNSYVSAKGPLEGTETSSVAPSSYPSAEQQHGDELSQGGPAPEPPLPAASALEPVTVARMLKNPSFSPPSLRNPSSIAPAAPPLPPASERRPVQPWSVSNPKRHFRLSTLTHRVSSLLAGLRQSVKIMTTVRPSAAIVHLDQAVNLPRQLRIMLLVAVSILYPALAQVALSTFACRRLDTGAGPYPETQLATWGYGYWVSDMNQECYLGSHQSIFVPLGAVCVFVFCVVPPLAIFWLLWRKRSTLDEPRTRAMYGFLYHRYRRPFYLFESVKEVQVLMLVIVDVFANTIYQYQQALLLLCVLLCIGVVNMSCRALRAKLLGLLEYLSLMVLALSITLGLFFVGGGAGSEMGLDSQSAEDAVTIIILIVNAGLLVVFGLLIAWPGIVRLQRRAAGADRDNSSGPAEQEHMEGVSGASRVPEASATVVAQALGRRAPRPLEEPAPITDGLQQAQDLQGEPGMQAQEDCPSAPPGGDGVDNQLLLGEDVPAEDEAQIEASGRQLSPAGSPSQTQQGVDSHVAISMH